MNAADKEGVREMRLMVRAAVIAGLIMTFATAGYAAGTTSLNRSPQDLSAVEELTERMMGDPAIMGLILALQENPGVQELLNDPNIVKAVAEGNFDALLADPRFEKLLADPKVREIEKRLQ